MTWVRIESNFLRHRKVIDLPIAAKMLFLGGLCYSAENGTDGHISKAALRVLLAELDVKPATARALEDAGLWHKQADGHDIHDYLVYQPSAEQERQRRAEHADRMKEWRERKTKARNASRDTSQPPSRDSGSEHARDSQSALSPNPNPNPIDRSSSSEPLLAVLGEDDDEEAIRAEAKRRLAAVEAQTRGPAIANPEAWVHEAMRRLRVEGWKPTAKAPAVRCDTCKDVPLYPPCEDCGGDQGE